MSSPLPLRFVAHVVDPMVLVCEGSVRPMAGQRVRATGSQGNGLLVVAVVERELLPDYLTFGPESFGIQLKYDEIPWPPDTTIEIV